jgi:hypothetical protein
MRVASLCGLVATVLSAVPACAEIEATAGSTREYESPLTLTVDFPMADSARWGKGEWVSGADFAELAEYVCDRVSVRKLEVAVDPGKRGVARVAFRGVLAARAGHDKSVTLKLELLAGDEVLGSTTVSEIGVEEKKENGWKARLEVPGARFSAASAPRLRITMSVEDD